MFWGTNYMQVVIGFSAVDSQIHFIMLMLTSPLLGAILSSFIADAWGGYEGKGMPNALTLCVIFGFLTTIFTILMSMTFSKMLFITFFWLGSFFAAAIMPIASGIIVGSVP